MRILVTGANGFIGAEIVKKLLENGHEVIGCARNVEALQLLFPQIKTISCDFLKDTDPRVWMARLKDIDIVINCVGILHSWRAQVIWKIHYETPRILFQACVEAGVQRIVQISALGVDRVHIPYAASKLAADQYLQTLPIDSVIIRPSFVYGNGSYGGSSLFRGLAGLPGIIPLPGQGLQCFQPIHQEDLAHIVAEAVAVKGRFIWTAVGTETVTLKKIRPPAKVGKKGLR